MVELGRSVLSYIDRERGQTLAEYSLILAFVFVTCVLVVAALGTTIIGNFQSFTDLFP